VPSWPEVSQRSQELPHAVLQQYPSTHWALVHSPFAAQTTPFTFLATHFPLKQ
jgi:hypothetical protein